MKSKVSAGVEPDVMNLEVLMSRKCFDKHDNDKSVNVLCVGSQTCLHCVLIIVFLQFNNTAQTLTIVFTISTYLSVVLVLVLTFAKNV
jgi:hypothetical protein